MQLQNLKPNIGSKHRKKRLGCGESSGHGKTSGRGGKGQSARSGSSIRIGFEGGQMPLIRRLPKRGFNNSRFKIIYQVVNLVDLNTFTDGDVVDRDKLIQGGLIKKSDKNIKILAKGQLDRRLTVKAQAFSKESKNSIEKLDGKAEIVN